MILYENGLHTYLETSCMWSTGAASPYSGMRSLPQITCVENVNNLPGLSIPTSPSSPTGRIFLQLLSHDMEQSASANGTNASCSDAKDGAAGV